MIQEGTLVERVSNDSLILISPEYLRNMYPPEGAVCVVVSSPRERDVMDQRRRQASGVALSKVIDVLYEGRVYSRCVKSAFKEIKSHVQ